MKLNRMFALFTVLILIMSACTATAEIMPCADDYFVSASAYLASDKSVTFDFSLYGVFSSISVTEVWLEQKVDGEWMSVGSLPRPSYVATNMADYGAEVDYSSSIGTGTFRVGFIANADGHTVTRYSNSRTF